MIKERNEDMKMSFKVSVGPTAHTQNTEQTKMTTNFEGGEVSVDVEYTPEELTEVLKSQNEMILNFPKIISEIKSLFEVETEMSSSESGPAECQCEVCATARAVEEVAEA